MKTKHYLKEYTEGLEKAGLIAGKTGEMPGDKTVHHITFDSNDMQFGTLFVCKGAHFKEEYLQQAVEKGAFCYVSEKEYEAGIPGIIVSNIRKAMPIIAGIFYDDSWKDIHMIGITGTKGKSTAAFFLKFILDEYADEMGEPETAILSSIDTFDGVDRFESHLTTPEAMVLRKNIDNAVNSGISHLIMEVSSQALKYDRTAGIVYDTACFLNIGEDHISPLEHPDLEDYIRSKMMLFDQAKTICVNADSDYADAVIERCQASPLTEKIVTFGSEKEADITAYDIKTSRRGISFKVRCDSFDESFKIGMTGLFNVSNALAALAMAYTMNIPLHCIKDGLKKTKVKGRMEVFTDADEDITVIVDYAHNKMSFEALFESTIKEYPDSHISVVFGSTGDKAISRRKGLGSVAGRYADICYLTEDDPGTESPHAIAEELANYVAKAGGRYEIIDDREEAVGKAIKEAPHGGVVIVAAKGRDTTQKRGLEYVTVKSDVELVTEALAKYR